MKTMVLIGVPLNRWVAKAIGCDESTSGFVLKQPVFAERRFSRAGWRPADDWSQGGPIMRAGSYLPLQRPERLALSPVDPSPWLPRAGAQHSGDHP